MPLGARFGVEEEFVLLDAAALVPVDAARLRANTSPGPTDGGRFSAEFATSQIESATDPVHSLVEAAHQLARMRRVLAEHAPSTTVVAATGAPFALGGPAQISFSPHYDDVCAMLGRLASDHVVNGLHVHVEVTDDEERVRAMRRVREALPVLLALSANSPFAGGASSGHASWRSALIRRLPVSWSPPAFRDADEYHRTVDQLLEAGALPARSSVSWAVRLSARYETVETRVADAQLNVDDALLLTALTRALVVSDGVVEHPTPPEVLDASLWLAARHGSDARLLSAHGDAESARSAVERMLAGIRPVLDELGDSALVDEQLARLRVEGTGSQRQLRAHRTSGTAGLAALLRASCSPSPAQ